MKINNIISKYRLIWVLVVVVVLMVFIKLKYGYQGGDETELIPTPTLIPTITKMIATETTTSAQSSYKDYPLWQQLPYQGEGFVVDKYVAPKTLAVKVVGIDSKLAIKAVEDWLKTFGEAGAGHKIEIEN